MKSKGPELVGIHGLVFRSPDPNALAEAWRGLTGLRVLRRSRREIVLGGPELFVRVRRGRDERLEEAHLAVEDISVTRRKTKKDPMGGESWSQRIGELQLVLREFRRPPSASWRPRRRPV